MEFKKFEEYREAKGARIQEPEARRSWGDSRLEGSRFNACRKT